jgi:protein-tyrosine-phosphatase
MHCDVRTWNISDPSQTEGTREARLAAYRQVRDQLQQKILDLFPLADHSAF